MARPKTPRVVSGVTHDVRAGRYPRALIAAVVSWVLLGVILLFSTVGAPKTTNQDRSTEDAVDALNNTQTMAPSAQSTWWFPYLPVLGVLVVIAAILLALGYGWSRIVLAALGLVAVVALAQSALWWAIPAGVLLVVGSVLGLLLSVHRYLRDGTTGTTGGSGSSDPVAGEPAQ